MKTDYQTVSLEGMEFYAHHGYYDDEHNVGNKFLVDLHFQADLSKSSVSDQLEDTIDYQKVFQCVEEQMKIRSGLLEHAATRIVNAVKKKFSSIKSVELKLSKMNPPIKGIVQKVSVTVRG
ncbi:MAG: dihydroneopterin aldolase [Bacteroidetes bacterium]|nr:dihydroneopterin aldolase [Bacteroidota bacterium]